MNTIAKPIDFSLHSNSKFERENRVMVRKYALLVVN